MLRCLNSKLGDRNSNGASTMATAAPSGARPGRGGSSSRGRGAGQGRGRGRGRTTAGRGPAASPTKRQQKAGGAPEESSESSDDSDSESESESEASFESTDDESKPSKAGGQAAGTGHSPEGGGQNAAASKPRRVTAQRKASVLHRSLAEHSEEEDGDEDPPPADATVPGSPAKKKVRVEGKFTVVSGEHSDGRTVMLQRYQPVRVAWAVDEDAACTVCGDDDGAEGNVILLCEGPACDVAVHQLCYGVHKVPKGRWLCDSCKARLPPAGANCCLCPVVGGALRAVKERGSVQPAAATSGDGGDSAGSSGDGQKREWMVHLACALWTPEVTIADPVRMTGVSVAQLAAARQELLCMLCKQVGGAVV